MLILEVSYFYDERLREKLFNKRKYFRAWLSVFSPSPVILVQLRKGIKMNINNFITLRNLVRDFVIILDF